MTHPILPFSLIAFLAFSTAARGDDKPRHIFLLIGQSNMAGRAKIEEADEKPSPGAYLWNIKEKRWEAATPPYNRYSVSGKRPSMQKLNCGPSFAKAYLEANPEVEIGIVCSARGGTKIEQWDRENPDEFDLYRLAVGVTLWSIVSRVSPSA